MRLVIRAVEKSRVVLGNIEYSDDGTITEIEGGTLDKSEIDADTLLTQLAGPSSAIDGGIAFREVRENYRGKNPPDRDGEYRAVVVGSVMSGFWISNGRDPKRFEFRCNA
jgi:hypothetical protein